MSMAQKGLILGIGLSGLLMIGWFYFVLYNWLWLGLVNAATTGWLVGFAFLFLLFVLILTPLVITFCLLLIMLGTNL